MEAATAIQHSFHTPDVVTKQLKMNTVKGRQKVRVSSNFLELMGFKSGSRIEAIPSISGGFDVRPFDSGKYQVHSRRYKRERSNNPLESLVEFSGADLLGKTFPPATEHFHVTMRQGQLKIRPVPNRVFNIKRSFKGHSPYNAMVGLTGGVDVHCLDAAGFKTDVVLEWRPPEARDHSGSSVRMLEEVHALNTLRNGTPRVVMNEDIYKVDPRQFKQLCDEGGPIALGHLSLSCDDFSTAKSKEQKAHSVASNTSAVDMVYPAIRLIEEAGFPVVLIENVRGFQSHDAGIILKSMLTRLGYNCHDMVLNARDFGGIQNRTRYYLVATIFPGFEEPVPVERSTQPIWPIVSKHLENCRDITDTSFIKKRAESNRGVPFITEESTYAPTFLKSQSRGIKDGCYISHNDRIYTPSEELIQELMSIPDSFSASWCAREQAIETLGQSIDYRLHHEVITAVRSHIEQNLGQGPIVRHRAQAQLF